MINYDSPKGGDTIKGLLSRPVDAKGKLSGVVVVHENRGLNPYIEDVGRRAALAGFLSLALMPLLHWGVIRAQMIRAGKCRASAIAMKYLKILLLPIII
jgi:dienelactone hydrolase